MKAYDDETNNQKNLEKAGWKVGSVDEFLSLSPEESAYIEMKLALCDSVKSKRMKKCLSQKFICKVNFVQSITRS